MKSTDIFKKLSVVALVFLLATAILQLAGYYQTQHQLVSPLIPQTIIDSIATPFIILAAICFGIFLTSAVIHYYRHYKLSIVFSLLGILFPYVYMEFAG